MTAGERDLPYMPHRMLLKEDAVMVQAIVDAIRDRRRLRFRYHDRERLVEPQCYGVGAKGTELLRGYQLRGGLQQEPLFDVSKLSELVVLDETFDKPGPHYRRDDSAMVRIFRQL